MSIIKYILFWIVVAGITFYLTQKKIITVEGSYEDCIIQNIKNANNETAVNVIKSMCKTKYKVEDSFRSLDKDKVKDQLNEVLDLFKEFQKQIEKKWNKFLYLTYIFKLLIALSVKKRLCMLSGQWNCVDGLGNRDY